MNKEAITKETLKSFIIEQEGEEVWNTFKETTDKESRNYGIKEQSFWESLFNSPPHNWIKHAFEWNKTPEGSSFWARLSLRWKDHIGFHPGDDETTVEIACLLNDNPLHNGIEIITQTCKLLDSLRV